MWFNCVFWKRKLWEHMSLTATVHTTENPCVWFHLRIWHWNTFFLSISGSSFSLATFSDRLSSHWSKMHAEAPHLATYSGKQQESILEAQQNSHWLAHLPLTQPITMTKECDLTPMLCSLCRIWRIKEAIEPSASRLEEKWIMKGLLWDIGRIGANGKESDIHYNIAH